MQLSGGLSDNFRIQYLTPRYVNYTIRYQPDTGDTMTDYKQPSGIRRSGIHTALLTVIFILIVVFCVLMGLIISNKPLIEHDILAMSGILVMFVILFGIYFIVRKLKKELDEIYGKLEVMTTTDALTQVFNRNHFNTLLRTELSRAKRYERDLGCLILDIDNFRNINKKYGFQFGDEILQDIAELIKEHLRITDILARYESNKFICLLPETDKNAAMLLSKRLRGLVEGRVYEDKGESARITVSIGMTSFKPEPEDKTDIRNIINLAEKALNKAKEGGGNRIELL